MSHPDLELAELIARHREYPERLVMILWEWGQGDLVGVNEPDRWQMEFFRQLGVAIRSRRFNFVDAAKLIRMARGSGRGIGKSALVGMLIVMLLTWPNAKITVTANTEAQLDKRTWAEVRAWLRRSIIAHWFEVNSSIIFRIGEREKWFAAPITWTLENPQAFAGQQNRDSVNVIIFDEASTIPHKIWDVSIAGLTTGLPMFFAFGNLTESHGDFVDAIHGGQRSNYDNVESIDSRTCRFPNKAKIADEIALYGENSDYVRVWIRGLPPNASSMQFIANDVVDAAMARTPVSLPDDPLLVGQDFAWGGTDNNCTRFRKGADGKSLPPIYIPGELTRQPDLMVQHLNMVLSKTWQIGAWRGKVAHLFMDSAGIAGPVAIRLRELGHRNITEVNFGAHTLDQQKYKNVRSMIIDRTKQWMAHGALDFCQALKEDCRAQDVLKHVPLLLRPKDEIIKEIGHSTDDLDALALTFYMTIVSSQVKEERKRRRMQANSGVVSAWS